MWGFLRTHLFFSPNPPLFLQTCQARPTRAHTCPGITRRLCGGLGASVARDLRALRLWQSSRQWCAVLTHRDTSGGELSMLYAARRLVLVKVDLPKGTGGLTPHGPSPRLTISRPCSSHGCLAEAAFTQYAAASCFLPQPRACRTACRARRTPHSLCTCSLPSRLDMNQMSWHESMFRAQLKPLSCY